MTSFLLATHVGATYYDIEGQMGKLTAIWKNFARRGPLIVICGARPRWSTSLGVCGSKRREPKLVRTKARSDHGAAWLVQASRSSRSFDRSPACGRGVSYRARSDHGILAGCVSSCFGKPGGLGSTQLPRARAPNGAERDIFRGANDAITVTSRRDRPCAARYVAEILL